MLVQLSSDRQGSIAIIKLIFKVHCPNKIFLKRIKDTNVFVPKSQREREREREERGERERQWFFIQNFLLLLR